VAGSEKRVSAEKASADSGVGVIPRFALIIGAMKSGTSTLYHLLSQHPEICRCQRKEPHYFSYDPPPQGPSDYYRRWDFDPDVHRWALEASTSYAKFPWRVGTPERISEFPAEFRLIYILRDPIDRIESHIAHNVSKERHGALRNGAVHIGDHPIKTSSYAMQLDRYREAMPDVPILLLEMEDLKTAEGVRRMMRRCVDFLEIDTSFDFKEIAPRNVRKREGRTDEAVLSAAQRAELQQRLSGDVRRLRLHYGFDTSRWPGFD
jgi:hypothetical protein